MGLDDEAASSSAVRRRPVLLLDEIEKAYPDAPSLLQILDEGRLTDGQGRHVDFSNTVVIMTFQHWASRDCPYQHHGLRRGLGGLSDKEITSRGYVRARCIPLQSSWNRVDEIVVFSRFLPSSFVALLTSWFLSRTIARLPTACPSRQLTEAAKDLIAKDEPTLFTAPSAAPHYSVDD